MDFGDVHIPGAPLPDPPGALAAATDALVNNSEVLNMVNTTIAQPILGAINDNKQALAKTDRKLTKTATGNLARNAQVMGEVFGQTGASIRQILDASAAALGVVSNTVAATAPLSAGPVAGPVLSQWYIWFDNANCSFAVNNRPPPAGVSPGIPNPFVSMSAAQTWIARNGKTWIAANAPSCVKQPQPVPPSAGAGGPGTAPAGTCDTAAGQRCIILWWTFQCQGLDGKPAWAAMGSYALCGGAYGPGIGWGTPGVTGPAGSSNFDPFSPHPWSSQQRTLPCNASNAEIAAVCNQISAEALAAFPQMAADCPTGAPPPAGSGSGGALPPPPGTSPPPAGGATCPAPEPPPPPCSETGGDFTYQPPACNIPQVLQGGIPAPGSPEWCQALPAVRADLVSLGKAIMGALADGLGLGDMVKREQDAAGGGSGSVIWSAFTSPVKMLWKILGLIPSDTFATLKSTIKCWYSVVQQTAYCNADELVALGVVRGAVKLLEKLRGGTDLAIWLTVDINVSIDPVLLTLDYLIADACPAEIPSAQETVDAWMKCTIDDERAKCLLRMRGHDWDVWYPFIFAHRERLTPHEFIELSRRNQIDDTITQNQLRCWGYLTPEERSGRMALFDHLPSIADHLHWLQRNVFDSQYVADYSLLDGFATDKEIQQLPGFAGYTQKYPLQGRNFWQAFGTQLRALGMKEEYAALHYAAHWLNPAPGELAEMVHRLRPDNCKPGVTFTQQDYLRVLAEKDVAPYFRERYLAILYRTLPLRQLNQAAQQGRFNRDELICRWQDIGFNATDAGLMADTLLVLANRQRASLGKGYTPTVVSRLASDGLITRDAAYSYLGPQGFDRAAVDQLFEVAQRLKQARIQDKYDDASIAGYAKLAAQAYGTGAVDRANALQALSNAGYSANAAGLLLDTVDLRERYKAVNVAVKSIHKARLIGEVNDAGALAALQSIGVPAARAGNYVQQWALELTVPRVSASTSRILAWMRKGIISVANGQQRLVNLGWNPPDIQMMIAEVQQQLIQLQQKASAQNVKALKKAQDDAAKVQKQLTGQFCKIYPPARLKSWYARRIIDSNRLAAILTRCGYDPAGIADLLKEAEVARDALDARAAKKGATGIEYTGPGAITG